jgi:cytochrome c biogenesis protein CcdA
MEKSLNIDTLGAILGGIHAYFSIWQVCIIQVSLFFTAYIVGLCISKNKNKHLKLIICAFASTGFSVGFALINSNGLNISGFIYSHIEALRIASGLYIIAVAIFIALSPRIIIPSSESYSKKLQSRVLYALVSLIFGSAMATIYLPCISPALSRIMNASVGSVGSYSSLWLTFSYALGLALSMTLTALVLLKIFSSIKIFKKNKKSISDITAAALLTSGLLSVLEMTIRFKSFLMSLLP